MIASIATETHRREAVREGWVIEIQSQDTDMWWWEIHQVAPGYRYGQRFIFLMGHAPSRQSATVIARTNARMVGLL